MQKILLFLKKEYVNVNQAALLLGFSALASQLLGLFRDRLITQVIGPSESLDAYYAAFRVPDLIFISIASLASITVLIPFILERMKGSEVSEEAKKFVSDVFTVFFLVLFFTCFIVFLLIPKIIPIIAPGFNADLQKTVIDLSRIMLLSPLLLGLSNLFGSITQLFRKFFIYALSPFFYNLGIIFGIIFIYPRFGVYGLAFGVVFGALMHLLIQLFSSITSGFLPKLSLNVDFGNIKKLVLVSLPRTIGLSFNNIALIIIISLASYLSKGSISIFNLSLNLQSVPLGIIGLSYAVAAFPTLTRSYSTGKIEDFKNHLISASRSIIFWSLPIVFLFIVLRAQIVRVILGSSNFSWDNTRLVAASLAIFSISVMAQGLIALFARAYYAVGNTKRPLLINLVSSLIIVVSSFVFLKLFKEAFYFRSFIESALKVSDISGTEVLMLPLAYSFGTIINFLLLYVSIKVDFLKKQQFISKTFFQCLTSSFAIGMVTYFSLNYFSNIFDINTFIGVFSQGFVSGLLGIITGFFVLFLLKNNEFKELLKALKTKFWKNKEVSPIQESEGV